MTETEAAEVDLAFLVEKAIERVGDGLGLLHDLLHHEVLVAALGGGLGVHVDVDELLLDGLLVDAVEVHVAAVGLDDLHVVDVVDVLGVLDDGGDVKGDVDAVLGLGHDERGVLPREEDLVRLGVEHERQRIRTTNSHHRASDRVAGSEAVLQKVVLDEVHRHFRVGLAVELGALADLELGLLLQVVLDDAVVDADDVAVVGDVRAGVAFGGLAMGGPTGMADAAGPGEVLAVMRFVNQLLEFAGGLGHGENVAVADGDARGVVPAVFELAEPFQKTGRSLFSSNIANDATHR